MKHPLIAVINRSLGGGAIFVAVTLALAVMISIWSIAIILARIAFVGAMPQ
jgi:hypothetical protein